METKLTMNGHEKAFREALTAWIKAFLNRASLDEVDQKTHTVWAKTKDGTMISEETMVPSWSLKFLFGNKSLPEWKSVENTANSWDKLATHLNKMIGSSGSDRLIPVNVSMLSDPFIPQPSYDNKLNEPRLPIFNPQLFNHLFERLIDFLESKLLTYCTKTILLGLRVADSELPLRLNDDVIIEKLSSEEAYRYGEIGLVQSPPMGPKDIYDWPAIPWLVVTWRHCHSKLLIDDHDKIKAEWKPEFFEKSKHIQDSVLATLALTKFGAVGLGGHLTQLCNWELGSFSTMAFLTSETRVSQFSSLPGRYLELTSKDCIDLQEIFPLVLETNPITIALKRLSS